MSLPRASKPHYDCRTCGACCHDQEGKVLVTSEDRTRWKRERRQDLLDQLAPGHFSLPALAMNEHGRCVHLGTKDNPCDCSIYPTRPESCRALAVGDSQCRDARRSRGLPL